jgi:hypothetical protein
LSPPTNPDKKKMLKLPFFLGSLCVVCRKSSCKTDLVPGRARLAFTAISLGALRPNQEKPRANVWYQHRLLPSRRRVKGFTAQKEK